MTLEKLRKIVIHAYTTVPLYMNLVQAKDIFYNEFSELPIVDKTYYINSGNSGLSIKYMGEYIRKELIWTRTSGTSGKFTEVYWNKQEERRSMLSLWMRRYHDYGISAYDRMCYFFPVDAGDIPYNETRYELGISRSFLYADNFSSVYHKILAYNPVWMILQPSIALLLCDYAIKYGRPSELKYIELTGEYLEAGVRKKYKMHFSVKLQINMEQKRSILLHMSAQKERCI